MRVGDDCSRCGDFNDLDNLRMVDCLIPYNTSRSYYRKVKELVCVDCLRTEVEKRHEQNVALTLKVFLFLFGYGYLCKEIIL
jgi:hypothetical protein